MLAAIQLTESVVQIAYMVSAAMFTLGLIMLGKVRSARRGNMIGALGMAIAIGATLLLLIANKSWGALSPAIALPAIAIGSIAGWYLAIKVPMTAMPEFVAVFNGLGGAASMCVALAEVPHAAIAPGTLADFGGADFAAAVVLAALIGAVTFSGSMVAYAKLAGKLKKSRFGALGTKGLNLGLGVVCLALGVWGAFVAERYDLMYTSNGALALAALVLGVGLTLPIGGADMPVAIALLNSYSGIAGMTTGFVLQNNLLIVAGSLVGASGIILTQIMCKAMNRSLANVLFGGLEQAAAAQKDEGYTKVKSTSAEEVAMLLDSATSVIFVPGYGLAVAQAQHKVRELANLLQKKGCEVKYAIHPVAGRMPGHMNILLAEADVPYEQLFELDSINGEFKNADVAIVLGANDVCNPAAIHDPKSPIAGMPVLQVWEARTVVNVKRSLASGYAGIKNPLFELDNSLMLFSDAKKALEDVVGEMKSL